MRIFIVLGLAMVLSGCGYGSANVIRVQGEDCTLVGMEGFIRVRNASATIYRSMDCKTKSMEEDTRLRPNFIENGPASSLSIGSPKTAASYTSNVSSDPTPSGYIPK